MSRLDKIKVACSALSNRIQLYRMGADPTSALETKDVTNEVVGSVIEHVLAREGKVLVNATMDGKKQQFIITVEVREAPEEADEILH